MDMHDTREEEEEREQGGTVSPKKLVRRRKGRNYLIAAAVFFIISYIMQEAGISGGLVAAIPSVLWVVLLLGGLAYLAMGYAGRG